MRFNVEKTFLKGVNEREEQPLEHSMTFIQTEADDVNRALQSVLLRDEFELVDEVHWLPGSQAVTAVRQGSSFFMLQLFPAGEDDADGDTRLRN